jgi:molybdopterin-guanine dinucleotide biosynthesis protein A
VTLESWAAIVLAGGTSRRWGGQDKTAAVLGGLPVLCRAVAAVLPGTTHLVVVAPQDHPARGAITASATDAGCPLSWTREEPPGGGPVAGLAAGIAALGPRPPGRVVVLAGDLPFARAALPRLLAALGPTGDPADQPAGDTPDDPADVALGRDPDGRRQPLLAAYRTAAITPRLAGPVRDLPLRAVLSGLRAVEVPVTDRESLDLDTPESLARAQHLIDTGGER